MPPDEEEKSPCFGCPSNGRRAKNISSEGTVRCSSGLSRGRFRTIDAQPTGVCCIVGKLPVVIEELQPPREIQDLLAIAKVEREITIKSNRWSNAIKG